MAEKKKRNPRGPKCEICQAVMHIPAGKSAFECSFTDSHRYILKMRAEQGDRSSDLQRKKT